MSAGRHTVHVRINDSVTGQPTPVRLRLTGAEGEYFAPHGRLCEFATDPGQDVGGNVLLDHKSWCYVDGTCEVELPPGPLVVEAVKGFEFVPLRQEIDLKPGQLSLRVTLDRWIDLRRDHWYTGDTRVFFLPPHAALLEGAAEDLAVVNLLAAEWPSAGGHGKQQVAIPNLLAFSGQRPALELPGHLVVVNTHNSHPVLGSLGLLNCHRIVYPLSFGGPNALDNWALADWCDQCHRKGGLAVWSRCGHESSDTHGEPLADLLLGKVDALEIDSFEESRLDVLSDWYGLLGCGLRVPLVGASGKDSNAIAIGCMRTYARLQPDEDLTYKGWIEAVRSGRTFVSNGPLLSFSVNDQGPGAVIELPAPAVRIRAEARSVVPFDTLEIIGNGAVLASASASGSPSSAVIETELEVSTGGWLAARCRGQQQVDHLNQRVFAHTSPLFVRISGRPQPIDAEHCRRLASHLDRMMAWTQTKARCENELQRAHLMEIFQNARAALPKQH
jgi:hypothetical protein